MEDVFKKIVKRAAEIDKGRGKAGRELNISHFTQATPAICQALLEELKSTDIWRFLIDYGKKRKKR